jgi:hypothetical protein
MAPTPTCTITSGVGAWRSLTRASFVLTIWAPGLERRYWKYRIRDEDTAARLLAQASAAVTAGGVPMLRWWATHGPARS